MNTAPGGYAVAPNQPQAQADYRNVGLGNQSVAPRPTQTAFLIGQAIGVLQRLQAATSVMTTELVRLGGPFAMEGQGLAPGKEAVGEMAKLEQILAGQADSCAHLEKLIERLQQF